MRPHARRVIAITASAVALAGCARADDRDRPQLAAAIASSLTAQLGEPVRARCLGLVDACVAHLADGTALPVATARDATGGWAWQLDGIVVDTAPLAAYLAAEVGALGAPQPVACGARIRRARAGDRVTCALGGGGLAFATILPDGRTSIEIELDPAAARARAEADAAAEAALAATSRALADAPGEGEGEGEGGEGGEADAVPAAVPR